MKPTSWPQIAVAQLIRRLKHRFYRPRDHFEWLSTSWGGRILANPKKLIGNTIVRTGVFDITVAELLARLSKPGDVVVDAGANVGHMTLLSAVSVEAEGRVYSFEPHPELFSVLTKSVNRIRSEYSVGEVLLHNVGLASTAGSASLFLPAEFEHNDGLGHVQPTDQGAQNSIPIDLVSLDEVIGDCVVSVLKMDVEGYELEVLRGALRAISDRRITHIVFEETTSGPFVVARFLKDLGYSVFSVDRSLRGLIIASLTLTMSPADFRSPNFVATLEPDLLIRSCHRRGWRVLSPRAFQWRPRPAPSEH